MVRESQRVVQVVSISDELNMKKIMKYGTKEIPKCCIKIRDLLHTEVKEKEKLKYIYINNIKKR